MGPLVPDVISDEFSLAIALLIGFGFGFILEQAGFSSTRKLVGLFYGYDFTVLKVFFTAGVTAMIGVLVLSHFGILDINLIYINPTFLYSALIGGAIMGAGFIIGGFCPGTSVCAAAVGKIDAMAFVFGSLIGVFAFGQLYPALESLYTAKNMGALRIDVFFGLSPKLFAFILTFVAIAAFYFTQKIEDKINNRVTAFSKPSLIRNFAFGILPFIVIGILAITPNRNEMIANRIANAREQKKCVFQEITTDKLAYELMHNYYKFNLIDVRSPNEYKKEHLPLAINIPLDSMFNREWKKIFKQKHKINVFYANNDTIVRMACLSAKFIGKSENYILKETADEFRALVLEPDSLPPVASKKQVLNHEFRRQAAAALINLDKTLGRLNKPVKKKVRKIKGGCS